MSKMVNVGFGNVVAVQRIVAIVSPESAPVKRILSKAKEEGKLIDVTHGRRTRAAIIMDSEHVILSYLSAVTIGERAFRDVLPAPQQPSTEEPAVEKKEEPEISEEQEKN